MAQEKYPANCPWDLGPKQKQANQDEWILYNGPEFAKFSRLKEEPDWFHLNRNDEIFEKLLAYQARLTYQKLLDKGYRLRGPK